MISYLKILVIILLSSGFFYVSAQHEFAQNKLVMFTDRDYCISGDTVWFKVWMPEEFYGNGNIARVQLDGAGNRLINSVAKKNEYGWSEGYIFVPDSLSTGQYFLTAFLNSQRNLPDFETESISLLVYNRFEERVENINFIQPGNLQKSLDFNQNIQIATDKNEYREREKVELNISFNPEVEVQNAMVKVSLVDPLAAEIGGRYLFKVKSSNSFISDFIEKDGFVLSGKVVDALGVGQAGAVAVLSIAEEPPYFDYYLTGETGDFHFFLKNATGTANVVLQVVSESDKTFFIQTEENYLQRVNDISVQSKILTPEQSSFISDALSGNFIRKLFNPDLGGQINAFDMPSVFSTPFYGTPTQRVVPDEFIDLPNFQEISRELIPGFQYREKQGEITFRMLNQSQRNFFDDEPLRLINGIPVFKNSLFSDLKSTDIEYIDVIQNERVFGDLRFKGIVSVALTEKTNLWMAQQPGVARFNINCLQADKKPADFYSEPLPLNQPDIRQMYFWKIISTDEKSNINFRLSDVKGKVEISVEGITGNNKVFKASKIIEVK